MVHVRLNEKEANPNPHINFITPLKMGDPAAEEEARQLLRALAAQVRPIMKAEGFVVNSFEEYEHNKVFAGRNWNNGEVVELVLRGANGAFLPTSWLLSTLCHELAHIKHMNHGPAFQALWAKLRRDVRELQSKGYYGDGYWSSGTRLADSARMGSQGLDAEDLPEYMCGGAQSRARPTSVRRRRHQQAGPSNHTGAQTAKRRKAGSRVTAQGTFKGTGKALNEDVSDEEKRKAGTGFRKKAASKRAREERALAAERRLQALSGKPSISCLHIDLQPCTTGATGSSASTPTKAEASEDEEDFEVLPETDQDRRRAMLESTNETELENLKTSKQDLFSDFVMPPAAIPDASPPQAGPSRETHLGTIELSSDYDSDDRPQPACDVQSLPRGGTAASAGMPSKGKQKESRARDSHQTGIGTWLESGSSGPGVKRRSEQAGKLPYGALVQDEIHARKKESLGMSGNGRRLGRAPQGSKSPHSRVSREADCPSQAESTAAPKRTAGPDPDAQWSCEVCTLLNNPRHLACAACATPRGEPVWSGNSV
ncbi:WLM-domain-containing protein [Trametes cingulata]|nr:WLM-domain-containing protein [Trametes cingulata]